MEPMKAGKQQEGEGAVVPAACFWRIMSAAASFALANSVPLMLFLDFCSRASTSVSVCSTSIVHAQGDTYGGRRGVEGKGGAGAGAGKGVRSAVARERQGERLTTEDAAFWALARAWSRWLPRAMMCADWEMLRARRESGLLGGLGSVMSEFATCWCEETGGEVGAARAKKLSVAVGGRGPSRGRLDERFTKRRGREPMGRQRGGALQQVPVQQRTSGQPGGARL